MEIELANVDLILEITIFIQIPNLRDTVRIKYSALNDVKFTINKLEKLYKRKLRPKCQDIQNSERFRTTP